MRDFFSAKDRKPIWSWHRDNPYSRVDPERTAPCDTYLSSNPTESQSSLVVKLSEDSRRQLLSIFQILHHVSDVTIAIREHLRRLGINFQEMEDGTFELNIPCGKVWRNDGELIIGQVKRLPGDRHNKISELLRVGNFDGKITIDESQVLEISEVDASSQEEVVFIK